jgi:asparagine synthase (glutamine-hydrolysing)
LIGLCGVAFTESGDYDLSKLDLMSRAFANCPSNAVRSVTWRLPIVACRLFYRESERLPSPDARLESVSNSSPATAFVFGRVCPPSALDCTTDDPLARARFYFEASYRSGGVSSLGSLNGSWAAVICDNVNETIVLCRDRLGIQMLYYALEDRAFYFATHMSALQNIAHRGGVDRTGAAQFLHFLYIPSPRTIREDICCVPVGKAAILSRSRITICPVCSGDSEPYWRERRGPEVQVSISEALNRLDDVLISAVSGRSASSGRTAIFLSGGKDSSTLCIAASKIDPRRYLAVTVGFDDESVDESEDAAVVARHLGIEHLTLKFSAKEYLDALGEFVCAHGQPFGDPAGLPTYLAAKSLPTECEAVLDGTGSDSYMGIPVTPIERAYLSLPILRCLSAFLKLCLPDRVQGRAGGLVRRLGKPLREFSVSWAGWSEREIYRLFKVDPQLAETELGQLATSQVARHPVEFKTRVICRIWEPDTAYRKMVQPCNYLGRPVGFPLADTRLAGLFGTLPGNLSISGGTNKVLLRTYLARHLPERIVEKPKGSFEFDTASILHEDRSGEALKYFTAEMPRRQQMRMNNQVSAIIRRHMRGDSSLRDRVYSLAMLNTWFRLQSKGATCGDMRSPTGMVT